MSNKPEALRLADELVETPFKSTRYIAAAELYRLHEVNQELLEALKKCQKELSAWMQSYWDDAPSKQAVNQAIAAIAKATGGIS